MSFLSSLIIAVLLVKAAELLYKLLILWPIKATIIVLRFFLLLFMTTLILAYRSAVAVSTWLLSWSSSPIAKTLLTPIK